MFDWKDDYKVNHVEIDEQHKKLFEMGASMEELVKSHAGEDIYDELNAMLEELIHYTEYHFSSEEAIMAAANYENLERHKAEHEKFIDKLHNLDLAEMDDNQAEFAMGLLKTIATWIFKHIVGEDFLYKGLI
jgi:hemerythrin